ncbi:hypothetical protein HF290_03050 [Acidithiobacillus ferrooxidans]|uniref:helix-turn-helix transcriptional regulator n=1 Tax=Acidithiobacillus ferrooxidans TaxID=920 RepID=UPI001C070A97|nr:hypothetical protein [Acidithiobacillus ferrooxidans]MBU2859425.1 hypothetical protein [Acidithiobacillus ferrooxidans]
MDNRLLDVEALAPLLCLAPRTLYNKLCADPSSLPPRVKVPGTRGPRWRMSDVQAWLDALPLDTGPADLAVPAKRPGRRRKAVTV